MAGAERQITVRQAQDAPLVRNGTAVGAELPRHGVVSADDKVSALAHQGREAGLLRDVLHARGLVVERDLLQVEARAWGVRVIDLDSVLPDPRLIDALGATTCLRHGLVPWRRAGGVTVVALSRPEEFRRLRPMLEARLGPVSAGLAPAQAILAAVHAWRGPKLARAAPKLAVVVVLPTPPLPEVTVITRVGI